MTRDVEDELRRIFAADELDVAVRPRAGTAVVAGARRLRRKRRALFSTAWAAAVAVAVTGMVGLARIAEPTAQPLAGSGAVAATSAAPLPTGPASPPAVATGTGTITNSATTSTPTSTAKPPPRSPIGPSGYAGLTLGMTAAQAEATGLLVPNAQPLSSKGCKGYDYKGAPSQPNHYAVLISETRGLVRVAGRADAVTPEGLVVGASESDLKRLYPTQSAVHGAIGEWVTAVPRNAAAQYWIIVRNNAVSEIRIEFKVQDCYL
ncbi:MAG: hypothetical protein ACJ72N_12890 [Labedaea sp.]